MTSKVVRSERWTERSSRWERMAIASGLLFATVQLATLAFNVFFVATTHPPMDASPQETARGFAQAETMVEVGTYLYVLHLPFWLLFLGGLFGVLRRAEGDSGTLSVAALGAGITMAVIACVGTLVFPALFPLLAIGTLLFVSWVAALSLALLRSTRAESRVAPRADEATRVPVEPDGM